MRDSYHSSLMLPSREHNFRKKKNDRSNLTKSFSGLFEYKSRGRAAKIFTIILLWDRAGFLTVYIFFSLVEIIEVSKIIAEDYTRC